MPSPPEELYSAGWPRLAGGTLAAISGWLGLLQLDVAPWIASLVVVALGGITAWRSHDTRVRVVCFNLSAVLLIVGGFDAWFRQEEQYTETITNEGLWREDGDLGMALAPNGRSHHTRSYAGTPIFDAVYTTDVNGLRSGPPEDGSDDDECILVFGCSFAFGGGLNDEETLPYQLALRLRGQRRVRNFAAGGYGPHHLLALLQNGSVERLAHCKPVDALYIVIVEHVLRAAGRGDGLRGGPRFELAADGQLVRRGNYPRELESGISDKLALGAALSQDPSTSTAAEITLFRALVDAARRELASRFPGIGFHLLVWHPRGPLDSQLFDGLERESLTYVEDVLPPVDDASGVYRFAHDGHPTPLANRLLAEHLAKALTASDTPQAASR